MNAILRMAYFFERAAILVNKGYEDQWVRTRLSRTSLYWQGTRTLLPRQIVLQLRHFSFWCSLRHVQKTYTV